MAGFLAGYLIFGIFIYILVSFAMSASGSEETNTTSKVFWLGLVAVVCASVLSLPGFIAAIGILLLVLSGFLKLIKTGVNLIEPRYDYPKEDFKKTLELWHPIHQRGRAFSTVEICGIEMWGFSVDEMLLTEGTSIQERLIPFNKNEFNWENPPDELSHQVVQMDDTVYRSGGLFAKPDAIFEASDGHKLIVEVKSKCLELGLRYETEFGIYQYDPDRHGEEPTPSSIAKRELGTRTKDFLQVAIASMVYSREKNIDTSSITPILRYGDALILLKIPSEIYQKIEFYGQIYTAFRRDKLDDPRATIRSSELAAIITVVDKEFPSNGPDAKKYASDKGELIHLFAIHGKDSRAIVKSFRQTLPVEPTQGAANRHPNLSKAEAPCLDLDLDLDLDLESMEFPAIQNIQSHDNELPPPRLGTCSPSEPSSRYDDPTGSVAAVLTRKQKRNIELAKWNS